MGINHSVLRHTGRLLPLALGCALLAACAAKAPSTDYASCDKNFDRFLARFESDRSFQQSHTADPLRYEGLIRKTHCKADCPSQTKELTADKLRQNALPVYPLLPMQKAQRLESSVKVSGGTASVQMYLPDTDAFQVDYRFQLAQSCWQLAQVKDTSL
jgi:hypothetical protein